MNALAEQDDEIIREILARQLDIDPAQIIPEADIVGELGADSLDVVEISMIIEEKFNLNVPDQDMEKVRTVGDLLALVAGLKK